MSHWVRSRQNLLQYSIIRAYGSAILIGTRKEYRTPSIVAISYLMLSLRTMTLTHISIWADFRFIRWNWFPYTQKVHQSEQYGMNRRSVRSGIQRNNLLLFLSHFNFAPLPVWGAIRRFGISIAWCVPLLGMRCPRNVDIRCMRALPIAYGIIHTAFWLRVHNMAVKPGHRHT